MADAELDNFIGGRLRNVFAFHQYASGIRWNQAGNGPERRAFTRAVCADQCHDLAGVDLNGHVLQRPNCPVGYLHVFQGQHQATPCAASASPRYASMTFGLARISAGVPRAMIWP